MQHGVPQEIFIPCALARLACRSSSSANRVICSRGILFPLDRNDVRDYAGAIAQFDGLSRAKPGQEALGISQLTQSDRRHFRSLRHGTVAHSQRHIGCTLASAKRG